MFLDPKDTFPRGYSQGTFWNGYDPAKQVNVVCDEFSCVSLPFNQYKEISSGAASYVDVNVRKQPTVPMMPLTTFTQSTLPRIMSGSSILLWYLGSLPRRISPIGKLLAPQPFLFRYPTAPFLLAHYRHFWGQQWKFVFGLFSAPALYILELVVFGNRKRLEMSFSGTFHSNGATTALKAQSIMAQKLLIAVLLEFVIPILFQIPLFNPIP